MVKLPLFVTGLIIGFSVAFAVGPIALLCIRRSIVDGALMGLVSGLGAAAADTAYAFVAGLGVSGITQFTRDHATAFTLFGGCFLLVIGFRILRAPPPTMVAVPVHAASLRSAFGSTFVLTAANPMTIASFIGIFAGFGIAEQTTGWHHAMIVAGGVMVGSVIWWIILSSVAGRLSGRLTPATLHRFNVVAGSLIIAYGVWQLIRIALRA